MNLNPTPLTEERANEIAQGRAISAHAFSGQVYNILKTVKPEEGVKFGPLENESQAKKLRRAIGPATISLGWFCGYAPPNNEDEEHGRRLSAYLAEITEDDNGWYLEVVRKPQAEE